MDGHTVVGMDIDGFVLLDFYGDMVGNSLGVDVEPCNFGFHVGSSMLGLDDVLSVGIWVGLELDWLHRYSATRSGEYTSASVNEGTLEGNELG
jgi:hypothetical protein